MSQELEINGLGTGVVQLAANAAHNSQQIPTKATAPPPGKTASDEEIKKVLALAGEKLDENRVALDFNKASGQYLIKVIDKASGDVIRQYPPEEIVRLAEMLNKSSLLLDKEV